MPNVRQVFERAYGVIPEGATCHVGHSYPYEGVSIAPCYKLNGSCVFSLGGPWDDLEGGDVVLPDISDREAEAFRGFFDAAYDAALDALTEEAQ